MTPRTKAVAKAAAGILDDDDHIDVLVNSGETLLVKRKTLMLSPVFRDAFQMANIADGASSTAAQSVEKGAGSRIDIGSTAEAAKWLFGLMEGLSLERLGIPKAADTTVPPPVSPLIEARQLADKYDIPFFTQLLTEAMWSLAPMGKYQAITAFSMGFQLRNLSLCRFAVTHMAGIKITRDLELSVFQVLGVEGLWSILDSYTKIQRDCGYYSPKAVVQCGHWKSSKDQWAILAQYVSFPDT